jgi:hypothetical protein
MSYFFQPNTSGTNSVNVFRINHSSSTQNLTSSVTLADVILTPDNSAAYSAIYLKTTTGNAIAKVTAEKVDGTISLNTSEVVTD